MTKTQNYQLPQWVKEDRIMMDDFNEAMGNIESGLTAAKATADRAEGKADQKPYVTGSYRGTGADITIELGFRPSFVIVSGIPSVSGSLQSDTLSYYLGMSGGKTLTGHIVFTDTGFTLKNKTELPGLTNQYRDYDYIAFR